MFTVSFYTKGDIVEIREDWRDWKKGEKARVVDYRFERNDPQSLQYVILESLNPLAEHDINMLYGYQVVLAKKEREPETDNKKETEQVTGWEEAFKVFCDNGWRNDATFPYIQDNDKEKIINWVKANVLQSHVLPSAQGVGWISVEDKLPDSKVCEDGQGCTVVKVFAYVEGAGIYSDVSYSLNTGFSISGRRDQFSGMGTYIKLNPSHWWPVPVNAPFLASQQSSQTKI